MKLAAMILIGLFIITITIVEISGRPAPTPYTASGIGKTAPSFSLLNQDGQSFQLNRQRGKWTVLYFFPAADAPGCVCDAHAHTELLCRFTEMNSDLIGVTVNQPKDNKKIIEKYYLKFQLLSDVDHKVTRQFGARTLGGATGGNVVRATFIIGPKGIIRHQWSHIDPKGHADEVRRKLTELQTGAAGP